MAYRYQSQEIGFMITTNVPVHSPTHTHFHISTGRWFAWESPPAPRSGIAARGDSAIFGTKRPDLALQPHFGPGPADLGGGAGRWRA